MAIHRIYIYIFFIFLGNIARISAVKQFISDIVVNILGSTFIDKKPIIIKYKKRGRYGDKRSNFKFQM